MGFVPINILRLIDAGEYRAVTANLIQQKRLVAVNKPDTENS